MNFADIKLVVVDIDGTLLDAERRLLPETVRAIEAVQEKGIKVSLASGRAFISASRIARELHIDLPIIVHNGAYMARVGDEAPLLELPMDMRAARDLLGILEKMGCHIRVYCGDELFVQTAMPETIQFSAYHGLSYHEVGKGNLSQLSRNPHKITIIDTPEQIARAFRLLEPWRRQFNLCHDSDRGMEIVGGGVSKGNALRELCNILGIAMENVMAFGNEGNDLEMIRDAGVGIAMGNAYAGLKEAAKIITKANDELGVAYALNRYLLGRNI